MRVEIELTPQQVKLCRDWAAYWIQNADAEYATSILAKVAQAVSTYDRIYLEAIS